MIHSRPSYLAMLGVLFMGACVSSASCSSYDAKDAVADFDAACKKMFTASCAALAQCEPVVFGAQYKDVGDCAARTSLECAAYAKWNGIGWSAEKFDRCTSSLTAIACSQVAEGALASGACAVPAGQLPLGSACTDGL